MHLSRRRASAPRTRRRRQPAAAGRVNSAARRVLSWHVSQVRLLLEYGADVNYVNRVNDAHATNNYPNYRGSALDVACRYGHAALGAWLARVREAGGWACYTSEPRYQLVLLRELTARGQARRERAFHGKEHLLDLLFPGGRPNTRAKRDQPRLPDDVFRSSSATTAAAVRRPRRRPPPPRRTSGATRPAGQRRRPFGQRRITRQPTGTLTASCV